MTITAHTASRTLKAFHALGKATHLQVADKTGLSVKHVRVYIARYLERGHVERVNPGRNPAVHRLTESGLDIVLAAWKPSGKLPDRIPALHPLVAVWSPPRFKTGHLTSTWMGA